MHYRCSGWHSCKWYKWDKRPTVVRSILKRVWQPNITFSPLIIFDEQHFGVCCFFTKLVWNCAHTLSSHSHTFTSISQSNYVHALFEHLFWWKLDCTERLIELRLSDNKLNSPWHNFTTITRSGPNTEWKKKKKPHCMTIYLFLVTTIIIFINIYEWSHCNGMGSIMILMHIYWNWQSIYRQICDSGERFGWMANA